MSETKTGVGIVDAVHTIVLERMEFHAVRQIPRLAFMANRFVDTLVDSVTDNVIVSMHTAIYAECAQRETVTVVWLEPRSWFEHLRAEVRRWANDHWPRWMPWWLHERLACLNVRTLTKTQEVAFEHFIKYPDFLTIAQVQQRIKMFGNGVSETRVNGTGGEEQRRVIVVTPWWLL